MSDGTSPGLPSKLSLRLTTSACTLGLVGILFSIVHFIWPTPLHFALFMILGQGFFGMALVAYALAVLKDLKRKKIL